MKSLTLTLIVMIIMGCSAQNNSLHRELKTKDEIAYLHLLNHDNTAVVEDALYFILRYNIFNTKEINNQTRERIVFLANHGKTKKLRDRASIISDYLNIEDNYLRLTIKAEYLDKDKLFEIVDSKLTKKELIAETTSDR